jgi:ribosome biogenesis GTPase
MKSGVLMIDIIPGFKKLGLRRHQTVLLKHFRIFSNVQPGTGFPDCWHVLEPGCAMQEAVKCGTLFSFLLKNYHLLARDLAFEQEKARIELVRSERRRWKGITKLAKEILKRKWDCLSVYTNVMLVIVGTFAYTYPYPLGK